MARTIPAAALNPSDVGTQIEWSQEWTPRGRIHEFLDADDEVVFVGSEYAPGTIHQLPLTKTPGGHYPLRAPLHSPPRPVARRNGEQER